MTESFSSKTKVQLFFFDMFPRFSKTNQDFPRKKTEFPLVSTKKKPFNESPRDSVQVASR